MDSKELKKRIKENMDIQPEAVKLEAVILQCRSIMKEYRDEKRTDFWTFLSDVFRFDGMSIIGWQFVTLFVVLLGVGKAPDALEMIPVFMPLFVLAVIPAFMKGQISGMGEMEAVTRASGAQIALAKVILAAAGNLVCLTVTWCVEIYRIGSAEEIPRLILYSIVPILCSAALLLWRMRTGRIKSMSACMASILCLCAVWRMLPYAVPKLYKASALGVWFIAFIAFSIFFGNELIWIERTRKEGKMYGIIA